MKFHYRMTLAPVFALPFAAAAQETSRIDEIVVSAARTEQSVSALPGTVTVVDAETIRQQVAISDDLASVLSRTIPGFAPSSQKLAGRGETLRGRNPLYLVDGVPQHNALRDGQRDGHTIDTAFIERIEVTNGSNAIQGVGATGGVVNTVTRSPFAADSWQTTIQARMLSSDDLNSDSVGYKLSVLTGVGSDSFDFIAGLAQQERGLFIDPNGNAVGLYPTQGDRPEGTLSLRELQGFLFAVACAPEPIKPSEWVPLVSNEGEMGYADLNEAQHILGLLMVLYNQINTTVIDRSETMPFGCEFLEDTLANLSEEAPVSQWSRGLTLGHLWLEELWNEYVHDDEAELSKEFGACAMTLSFFGSRPFAEALFCEGSDGERPMQAEAFAKFAATMRRLFPSALASYADIGRTIAELPEGRG